MCKPSPTNIKSWLISQADTEYQRFSAGLLPMVSPYKILGVRLPILRKAAKILSRDWETYFLYASDDTFEEIMLQGMVIGCLRFDFTCAAPLLSHFLPKIDNWSVCDSFCAGLLWAKTEPEAVLSFINPCLSDTREYVVRFGVVMLLDYYASEPYLDNTLRLLANISHPSYYVKMAIAWAIATCFSSNTNKTASWLKSASLDPFVKQKAIQKICQSKKISETDKAAARVM